MTDEEINKALAEKVMGWRIERIVWPAPEARAAGCFTCIDGPDTGFRQFDPLENDADAYAVVDRFAAKEFEIGLDFTFLYERTPPTGDDEPVGHWRLWLVPCKGEGEPISVYNNDRRRAICEASLKAVGAWTE